MKKVLIHIWLPIIICTATCSLAAMDKSEQEETIAPSIHDYLLQDLVHREKELTAKLELLQKSSKANDEETLRTKLELGLIEIGRFNLKKTGKSTHEKEILQCRKKVEATAKELSSLLKRKLAALEKKLQENTPGFLTSCIRQVPKENETTKIQILKTKFELEMLDPSNSDNLPTSGIEYSVEKLVSKLFLQELEYKELELKAKLNSLKKSNGKDETNNEEEVLKTKRALLITRAHKSSIHDAISKVQMSANFLRIGGFYESEMSSLIELERKEKVFKHQEEKYKRINSDLFLLLKRKLSTLQEKLKTTNDNGLIEEQIESTKRELAKVDPSKQKSFFLEGELLSSILLYFAHIRHLTNTCPIL